MNGKILKIPIVTFLVLILTLISCVKNEKEHLSKDSLETLIRTNLEKVTTEIEFNKIDKQDFEKIQEIETLDPSLFIKRESLNKNTETLLLEQASLAIEYVNRYGESEYVAFMLETYLKLNPKISSFKRSRLRTPCYNSFEKDVKIASAGYVGCVIVGWGPLGAFVCGSVYSYTIKVLIEVFEECCGC